ncbi:MAG: YihY/virulence factor BrkB family protein [Faecalimonas sp.]|nr:YihY/virulence factor BrkB family protein [Faecalimonas sp.]
MKAFFDKIFKFMQRVVDDHVAAYAAQSAFFLVLSLIPIILLLMTLVQYTPLTKADVMTAAYQLFPATIRTTIVSIINEVYNQSRAIIPVTALIAIWSAGRGTLAITNGLNCIHGEQETRNYFVLRIRAAFYTVLLILSIVLCLLLLGFGNGIGMLLVKHLPFLQFVVQFIIEIRTIVMMLVLMLLFICIYRFLPNHRRRVKLQLPGAVFTAIGWTLASYVISIYTDIFKGFTNMYGSLTTIVLIMLWLYFCMYILLLGGEINVWIEENLKQRVDIEE